ncbi:thiosulfate sulfurtransferase GlpE [Simiduia curdlanivorans]|uniref:Thiosulfate sulfurtransferase GlpE n=1 Tax=Simiduia curdlanivorans TaxID=1492769 RepID=A0ABV8V5S3_9GAMM|nr:thiosulfate sulfurtransferase GlpE [Simiduia curdlanivorans]MDN3638580.1 thiosulfate sulfurtransferase GlpE [Simiduia curdlanivorans]
MTEFKHLSCESAWQLMRETEVVIVDIRDELSYKTSHIKQAIHLSNESAAAFIAAADKDLATIVCCYHGNSSQSAAQYLASQAFTQVYSLDGGFQQWQLQFPEYCQ